MLYIENELDRVYNISQGIKNEQLAVAHYVAESKDNELNTFYSRTLEQGNDEQMQKQAMREKRRESMRPE